MPPSRNWVRRGGPISVGLWAIAVGAVWTAEAAAQFQQDDFRLRRLDEGVFECADIIGRVFDDTNRNGAYDPGEPGVGGAQIVSVEGFVITTDAYGRYHLTCAAKPAFSTGSTFILRLNEASLPQGSTVLSENPVAVRLTRGRAHQINYAVALGPQAVRVDVSARAFSPGSLTLRQEWAAQLPGLIEALKRRQSSLTLFYSTADGEAELGPQRLDALAALVRSRWDAGGGPYPLVITYDFPRRRQ